MTPAKRHLIGICLAIGITCFVAGFNMLYAVHAQDATPDATPEATPPGLAIYSPSAEAITPTGDNGYCLMCHSSPWQSVTLQDGTIFNLYVNPDRLRASVHGENSSEGELGCLDCHGTDAFPHSGPTPTDARTYSIDSVAICASCHTDQVNELLAGLHEEAILAGNTGAAVCTDCHSAHDVQPVVEEPELIAGVCGDCHTSTLTEWRVSEHVDIGPLGCATCHSPHSQRIRAGETSNELCLNCHNEMPNLWVHQQHGGNEYPVECVDCHMYRPDHNQLVTVGLGELVTGHTMQLDSVPCTTCHEQLLLDGTWATLGGDSTALQIEVDTLRAELAALEPAPAESAQIEPPTYAPLLQGLMVGLGLGATVAAIFVARGRSHPSAVQAVPPEPVTPAPTEIPPTAEAETSKAQNTEEPN